MARCPNWTGVQTITTTQGNELWFRFQRIDDNSIVGSAHLGEQTSVAVWDVAGLTTDRVNADRTAAAVGAGAAAAIAVAIGLIVVGGSLALGG